MEVTITITAPKLKGCGHFLAEYSDGKEVCKYVYHIDDLKTVLKLADIEPQLKRIVAKTVVDEVAKSVELSAISSIKTLEV
jgi:hypothetical protein